MVQTLEKLYDILRWQLQTVARSPLQATTEANWILEAVLGEKPEAVYRAGNTPVTPEQAKMIDYLLHDRVSKRIPIQYLLHYAWFYGLKFYVNPHVLIPRPETELLVEEALRLAAPGARILDVGTGPGSIALALACTLKKQAGSQAGNAAIIAATDISPEALHVARINAKTLGVQVDFHLADLFMLMPMPVSQAPAASRQAGKPSKQEAAGQLQGAPFDLIVSNPPYIDPALKPTLDAEVVWHEPALALFPPSDDPGHFYRRLASEAPAHINPGGHLLMEVGAGMAEEVGGILDAKGWKNIRFIPDYAGIDRVVVASM